MIFSVCVHVYVRWHDASRLYPQRDRCANALCAYTFILSLSLSLWQLCIIKIMHLKLSVSDPGTVHAIYGCSLKHSPNSLLHVYIQLEIIILSCHQWKALNEVLTIICYRFEARHASLLLFFIFMKHLKNLSLQLLHFCEEHHNTFTFIHLSIVTPWKPPRATINTHLKTALNSVST